jgi:predicted RNA-binding protein with PIN domain
MALLIDGYNLLHASGILPRGRGPGSLERARLALLNFLVESLEPAELARAVIVFDAPDTPRILPGELVHRGLKVYFARGPEGADERIEELIRQDSAPRKLVVVSSDHRLHRAARRRRAHPIDSDRWHGQLIARRFSKPADAAAPAKPASPSGPDDVAYWLEQFAVDEQGLLAEYEGSPPAGAPSPAESGDPVAEPPRPIEHPFPPEYLEELKRLLEE